MPALPRPLTLEPLEAREVPAVGLDPAFAAGGLAGDPFGGGARFLGAVAVAAGPNGTVVAAGNTGGAGEFAVGRLDAAGRPDPTFGGGDGLATGLLGAGAVVAVATAADGSVVVAGTAPTGANPMDGSDLFVLRLRPNGTRDPAFGAGGVATLDLDRYDAISRVAVQADGKVVLLGTAAPGYPDVSATTRLVVARLTADGRPDAAFGRGGSVQITDAGNWEAGGLVVLPTGAIAASGAVLPSAASARYTELAVLRFRPDGSPDPAFGTGGRAATHYDSFLYAHATGLAALPDGRLVVSGGSSYGQGLVAWFGPSGAPLAQERFNPGGGLTWVAGVVPAAGGGVLAAGTAGYAGGFAVQHLAAPGAAAEPLPVNPGGRYVSPAVAAGPGGTLVVAATVYSAPIPAPLAEGYPLAVTRFADPGTAASRATLVEANGDGPALAGRVALTARAAPLLGGAVVADGTLTFREGATVLAAFDLAGGDGFATLTTALPAGDHAVTVEYSGSSAWAASRTTLAVRVEAPAAPPVALTVSDANPALGEAVALVATVRAGGGVPLLFGSVTFLDGDRVLGVSPVDIGGTARLTTTALGVGSHAVRAAYDGGTAGSGESAAVAVDVTRAYAGVALAAAAPVAGRPVALAAAVRTPASPGVTPTGTVDFFDGLTRLGSVAVRADGTAAFAATLGPGAHTLRAVYGGDRRVFAADSNPVTLTVPAAAPAAPAALRLVRTLPVAATEGTPFTANLAAVILPAGAAYRVWVFWGDGRSGEAAVTRGAGADTFTLSGSHTYAAPGSYSVTLRVMADGKMALEVRLTAAVADARWYVGRVAQRLPAGQAFGGVVATIQDTNPLGGAAADYTATIDWGDGRTGAGLVRRTAAGRFEVTGAHTYEAPGRPVVRVTIRSAATGREAVAVSLFTIDPARTPPSRPGT